MAHEENIAVLGVIGRTAHRRRASDHILCSLWPLEHGRLHPGLPTHFPSRRAGWIDPDLLLEPPFFFRCTLRRADCVPAGFSAGAVHDDRRRIARYSWDIDSALNPLGALHVDRVVCGKAPFAKLKDCFTLIVINAGDH
jgi:hypothetical protein